MTIEEVKQKKAPANLMAGAPLNKSICRGGLPSGNALNQMKNQ